MIEISLNRRELQQRSYDKKVDVYINSLLRSNIIKYIDIKMLVVLASEVFPYVNERDISKKYGRSMYKKIKMNLQLLVQIYIVIMKRRNMKYRNLHIVNIDSIVYINPEVDKNTSTIYMYPKKDICEKLKNIKNNDIVVLYGSVLTLPLDDPILITSNLDRIKREVKQLLIDHTKATKDVKIIYLYDPIETITSIG